MAFDLKNDALRAMILDSSEEESEEESQEERVRHEGPTSLAMCQEPIDFAAEAAKTAARTSRVVVCDLTGDEIGCLSSRASTFMCGLLAPFLCPAQTCDRKFDPYSEGL